MLLHAVQRLARNLSVLREFVPEAVWAATCPVSSNAGTPDQVDVDHLENSPLHASALPGAMLSEATLPLAQPQRGEPGHGGGGVGQSSRGPHFAPTPHVPNIVLQTGLTTLMSGAGGEAGHRSV